MEVFSLCHPCCCNGEWKIEVIEDWTDRNQAEEEQDAPMCCSPWTLALVFNLKIHSVLGLWIEGASYESGFCRIDLSGNMVEAQAVWPWSGSRWLLVITTPVWLSIHCWCSRRGSKGAVASWRRLKAFGGRTPDGWASRESRAASRSSAL